MNSINENENENENLKIQDYNPEETNDIKENLNETIIDSSINDNLTDNDLKLTKTKKNPFKYFLLLSFLVILGGLSIGTGYKLTDFYILKNQPTVAYKYIPELAQISEKNKSDDFSIVDIAKKIEPSIVAITTEITQNSFFGITTGSASGSGIIFNISSEKIYIMTNYHVIENSTKLFVHFSDNKSFEASIIGYDQSTDLAVITVDVKNITNEIFSKLLPITLGDSEQLQVGETAIAIGNPLGYNNTVTVGIISALNRIVNNDLNAFSLIQTDAAINPGNSGGALVNAAGELIGINSVKIADTAVEGIGFAIPINSAIPILEEIIAKGYVSKPFFGIWGGDITKETAEKYNLPLGVVISEIIKDAPASKAGLKKYDIITQIEDIEIDSMDSLNSVLSNYNIGDIVTVKIRREINENYEYLSISVTIGDKHDYEN